MLKKISFLALLTSLFLCSCKEELDSFIPNTTVLPLWIDFGIQSKIVDVEKLYDELGTIPQVQTHDASNDIKCWFSSGNTTIEIPKGSLIYSTNKSTVTGNVSIEFILINKLGDIIKNNRPTVTSDLGLTTGGSYFLKITQNGTELEMKQGSFYSLKFIPSYGTNTGNKAMIPFSGVDGTKSQKNENYWVPLKDSSSIRTVQDSGSSKYLCSLNKFRWINCDYFIDSTNLAKPKITLDDAKFTNANTAVFMVFKNLKLIVSFPGDPTDKTFKIPTGYKGVPIDADVVIISVSKINNDYYFGSLTEKIQDSKDFLLKPKASSLAEIKTELDKL